MRKILFALGLGVLLLGCSLGDDEAIVPQLTDEEKRMQLEIDTKIIDDYLAKNGIQAEIHASGLRYVIDLEGTGDMALASSTVTVRYTGTLLDGRVFDQTEVDPFQSELFRLIDGWKIGFQLLKEGSKARLYVPSGLGYGPNTPFVGSIISPNENLIFEVELLSVD